MSTILTDTKGSALAYPGMNQQAPKPPDDHPPGQLFYPVSTEGMRRRDEAPVLEQTGLTYEGMADSSHEEQLTDLVKSGSFHKWGQKIKAELKSLGVTEQELVDIALDAPDPDNDKALKKWMLEMGSLVLEAKKKMRKRR